MPAVCCLLTSSNSDALCLLGTKNLASSGFSGEYSAAKGAVTLALPLLFFFGEMPGFKRCFESPAGASGLLMNASAAVSRV